MARRDLPRYVYRRGRARRPYFCRGGPNIPIHAEPGTPEFHAEYTRLLLGSAPVPRGYDWRYLIANYRGSDRYTQLASRTKADYDKVLDFLVEKWGKLDPRKAERKDVIRIRDHNRETIRFANYCVQVIRVVLEHAIDIGWIKRHENPAVGTPLLATPEAKKQPHIPWTDEAVKLWREEAALIPHLIFELGMGTVQRPGDWPMFDWEDFDGASLRLTQGKTGKALWLPCSPHLLTALEAAPRPKVTRLSRRPILVNQRGRRMVYRTMAQVMLAERRRLGLEAFDLHAIRYRGVMELAWAGCTDDEIMSYSGHDTKQMVEKYAGKARQIMRATSAAEKRRIWAEIG